jgi:hypothetical protein
MSFETGVLRSLGKWFPQYEENIERIVGNIRDLEVPFRRRDLYQWQMSGSSSLKSVLPAMVPDLCYNGMEISEGGMASEAYFKMNELQDPVELQKLRSSLLEYCHLDTLAMVKILEKLRGLG